MGNLPTCCSNGGRYQPALATSLDQHLGLPFKPLPKMEAWTDDEDADPEEEGTRPRVNEHDVAATFNQAPLDLGSLRSLSWNAPIIESHGESDEDTGTHTWESEVEAWCAQHNIKIDSKLSGQARELWVQSAKTKHEQQFGLGVVADVPPNPRSRYPPRKTGLRRLINFIRTEHAKFVPGGRNQSESNQENDARDVAYAAYDQWVSFHSQSDERDPFYRVGFRIPPAQEVSVVNEDPLPEPDESVALTPDLGAYTASALYVKDFRVKRRKSASPSDGMGDDVLEINHVIMPAGRVLADTGAAPSVITTQMLERLPRNSCVSRNANGKVGRLNGPNGKALITDGTATIDFELGETPCRHQFSVIEGRPLLLLGKRLFGAA